MELEAIEPGGAPQGEKLGLASAGDDADQQSAPADRVADGEGGLRADAAGGARDEVEADPVDAQGGARVGVARRGDAANLHDWGGYRPPNLPRMAIYHSIFSSSLTFAITWGA